MKLVECLIVNTTSYKTSPSKTCINAIPQIQYRYQSPRLSVIYYFTSWQQHSNNTSGLIKPGTSQATGVLLVFFATKSSRFNRECIGKTVDIDLCAGLGDMFSVVGMR